VRKSESNPLGIQGLLVTASGNPHTIMLIFLYN